MNITSLNTITQKWLIQSLKGDTKITLSYIGVGFLSTLIGFSMALFSEKLIDEILPAANYSQLLFGLASLTTVVFLKVLLGYFRRQFLSLQNQNFTKRAIHHFFSVLLHLPQSFFDRHSSGGLLGRINRHKTLQKNSAYFMGTLYMDFTLMLTTALFMTWYSSTIALVLLLFMLTFIYLVLKLTKTIKMQYEDQIIADEANQNYYLTTFQGISVIKNQNAEDYFLGKLNEAQLTAQDKTAGLESTGNRFMTITELLNTILVIIILSIGYFLFLNRQLRIGELTAIMILTGTLFSAIHRLTQVNIHLQEINIAVDRTIDLSYLEQEYKPEEKETLQRINLEVLRIKNLSFSYPGTAPVFKDISFQVSRGETIALLGENSSGKSTVMAILQKLYAPQSGSITVNNQSLNHISTPSWRNIIGIVPQEIELFMGTLSDNIGLGVPHSSVPSIIDFCTSTGLSAFFEALPQGYFTQVGSGGLKLSGGQKQLIGLARALYRRPQLLLLDEVTSAMDSHTEKFTLNLLNKFKRSMAIILITHKTEMMKLADRIYVIKEGKLEDPYKFAYL